MRYYENLEHLFDNYYFTTKFNTIYNKIEVLLIVKASPSRLTPSGEYNIKSTKYKFFPSKEKSRKKAMKLALNYDKKKKKEKRLQEKSLQ